MQLRLGTHVRCEGSVIGEVADVVIDPASRRLTHVVVEANDSEARLVPASLVAEGEAGGQEVGISLTKEKFGGLRSVLEFSYASLDEFPASDGDSDVGVET